MRLLRAKGSARLIEAGADVKLRRHMVGTLMVLDGIDWGSPVYDLDGYLRDSLIQMSAIPAKYRTGIEAKAQVLREVLRNPQRPTDKLVVSLCGDILGRR